MILDTPFVCRTDIVAEGLKSVSPNVDNITMQERNSEYQAMLITLFLFLLAALALVGCGSSSSSPTEGRSSPPPCYSADEPMNDSFLSTEPIVAEADRFVVEGYIHHGDLDCMVVLPYTAIAGRSVYASFDYAFGWDMDVSLGYRDAQGIRHTLHAEFDSWGQGVDPFNEQFPADAVDITLSIGQRTLNYIPDSTRYTIEVEIF